MPTNLVSAFNIVAIIIGLLCLVIMLTFAGISAREKEPRAARRALVGAFLLPIPYIGAGIIGLYIASPLISLIILFSTGVLFFSFVLPIGNRFPEEHDKPTTRFDERDIMFSRRSLVPGTDRFETYYQSNPDKKPSDDKFRRRPGLLAEGALYYDTLSAAAANASFETVGTFHQILDRELREVDPDPVEKSEMSRFLKRWTKKLGAVSAGITELHEYHLYSNIGRGERYGDPVELDHHYALAITVEMDKVTMDSAPYGPTVMESAQQYLNSGAIAVQVAQFIRNLGYSARAHIDGSYRVICPLVARDAGLGEIGRMGLLMTPELGPRVRLAVVTTDMPLIADQQPRDRTMIDFCRICLKCADVCPSNSIPTGEREEMDGVLRWRIDAESCFTYWCAIGTDCGLCMRSCPFSHPDNVLHNVVRAGVKRSGLFRPLALILDDLFYGRVPVRAEIPSWIKARSQL